MNFRRTENILGIKCLKWCFSWCIRVWEAKLLLKAKRNKSSLQYGIKNLIQWEKFLYFCGDNKFGEKEWKLLLTYRISMQCLKWIIFGTWELIRKLFFKELSWSNQIIYHSERWKKNRDLYRSIDPYTSYHLYLLSLLSLLVQFLLSCWNE